MRKVGIKAEVSANTWTNLKTAKLNYTYRYIFLTIGWELRVSRMEPLRSGPRDRTDGMCQYKTPGVRDTTRAQRGRARSALFYRVYLIEVVSTI